MCSHAGPRKCSFACFRVFMYGQSGSSYCIVPLCLQSTVYSQNSCRKVQKRALRCCSGEGRKRVRLVLHVGSNRFDSGHGRHSASHRYRRPALTDARENLVNHRGYEDAALTSGPRLSRAQAPFVSICDFLVN